ncbi:TIGR00341 family protein [Altererythrobacter sp. ZODW24]|uniref:TIGR00341 family protein n=1 Tax=Altererythrobacter sp. ZODW24 TaxID=2185142 RepID=UPI000DF7EE99|nr:TIGR00341 family protein [Altererythrobacter sp. ZODW24]
MSVRLVEIFLPDTETVRLESILARHCRRYWRGTVPGEQERYSCLLQQRYTERLLKELEAEFGDVPSFSTYVGQIEAAYPPIYENRESELRLDESEPPPSRLERFFSRDRLSTDELYDDIADSLIIRPSYLMTVFFSAIIASLGMRSGQTAVVIGAMIIAPLLGPTLGLALAATIGNARVGIKAGTTLAVGSVLAVISGAIVGASVTIDPLVPELLNRTVVQPADIALSLACGAAGVLAFSRGSSMTLVGVMIAVALVPPLSATGVYLAAGYPEAAGGALYLFAINLVCVNAAGIATFLLQGLPPKDWRATGGILAVWTLVLILLASMMACRFALGFASLVERLQTLSGV